MSKEACTITKIEWERAFLKITFIKETDKDLFLMYEDKSVLLQLEHVNGNEYKTVLNMVLAEGRSFLDNGSWRIGYYGIGPIIDEKTEEVHEGWRLLPCKLTDTVGYELENLDKIFRYGNNRLAYTVSFEPYTEDDVELHTYINARFMVENSKWRKKSPRQESRFFISLLRNSLDFTIKKGINLFYQIVSNIYPKRGDRILLISETHNSLWGNLKSINDRLLERELDKEYKIDTSFRVSVGSNSRMSSWIKTIMKIAKSDYILVDDYAPVFGFINLNKKTELIQVWHSSGGFKAVGYCRFGKIGSPHPIVSCHRAYSKAIAPSESLVSVFSEVFGIEKESFIVPGTPTMDHMLDPDRVNSKIDKVYEKYPFLKDKKIILFAPTYRGKGQKDAFYDYSRMDFKRIYDFCGDDYIFLIKMHPFIKEKPPINDMEDRIINVTAHSDISDFYHISDILITDYSSCYYEFTVMDKPIIFYVPDKALYEVTRGVHQHIDDAAPGKVVNDFDELIASLENEDFDIEKTLKYHNDNFEKFDGGATDRFIDEVFKNS